MVRHKNNLPKSSKTIFWKIKSIKWFIDKIGNDIVMAKVNAIFFERK